MASVDLIAGTDGLHNVCPAPAPAAGGMTVVDLSAGAEANTAMKAGGTTLGTTSTLVCATLHGNPDGGKDCYTNLTVASPSTIPAATNLLHVRLEIGTLPPTGTSSGRARLSILVSNGTTLATMAGYHGGTAVDASAQFKRVGPEVWGVGGALGATFSGNPGIADLVVAISQSTDVAADAFLTCGGTSGLSANQETTDVDLSGGVYVGLCMGQGASTPTTELTWTGVVLSYQWLDGS